ncbi:MAG: response regulator transcription factor [Sphingomonadales bacterium]|nr:response regulator transcription factor [Sphingomonadales bacterium]
MITIALADNQLYFKKGIIASLSAEAEIDLRWMAEEANDLSEALIKERPDLLLLGMELKGLDLFAFLENKKEAYPDLKLIVFTLSEDLLQAKELLNAGVNGVLSRESDCDDIVQAVRAIIEKDMYFNELVSRALLTRLRRKVLTTPVESLRFSKNEIRVLELLAEGCKTEEIANRIFLSVKSVENIRYQLKVKTGVNSSTALVVYALRNRLIR